MAYVNAHTLRTLICNCPLWSTCQSRNNTSGTGGGHEAWGHHKSTQECHGLPHLEGHWHAISPKEDPAPVRLLRAMPPEHLHI